VSLHKSPTKEFGRKMAGGNSGFETSATPGTFKKKLKKTKTKQKEAKV